MPKRALLIGSEIHGLQGVNRDVDAMAALLATKRFGFDGLVILKAADATRAGILAAYEHLVDVTRDGDTAVVYYAGHGAYLRNPTPRPGEPDVMQCIVPTDWDEPTEFRGIADYELSAWMARLAKASPNTTVILDCCHSAQMSRDARGAAPVVRAVTREWTPGVTAFFAAHPPGVLTATGNPAAVRMVAAEADRPAFECDFEIDGRRQRCGVFTRAFERVLTESDGAPLTWRAVNDRVRELVIDRVRDQRPSAEGPVDRLLFALETRRRSDAIVYFEDRGKPALRGSRVLGLRCGAIFDVMPPAALHDPAHVITTATVESLAGTSALVSLGDPAKRPPIGALAYPRELPFPALPVVLDDSLAADLRESLGRDRFLEIVTRDAPHIELSRDAAGLHVRELGRDTFTPVPDDARGRAELSRRLENLARSRGLRDLHPDGLGPDAIELAWGRVVGGAPVPAVPGDALRVGDSIYVSVRNNVSHPLWVAIYDLGVCGEITLLNPSPDGAKVEPRATFVLGNSFGTLAGIGPAFWSADVPADEPRRESLVIVYADHAVDFDLLESRSMRGPGELEALFAIRRGVTRNFDAVARSPQRYGVRVIDFDLRP